MPKSLLFLVCLLGFSQYIPAQNIWTRRLPTGLHHVGLIRLSFQDGQYFAGGSIYFAQLDRLGSTTGFVRPVDVSIHIWSSTVQLHSANSGHPYFLLGRRQSNASSNFLLSEYRPGVGLVNETAFADTAGSLLKQLPIIPVDDSTFVVFGRKYYRKIKYSQTAGFTEEWAMPLNMAVESAFFHNGLFIVADALGNVKAVDEAGNTIWARHHAFSFRALKAVAGGFIGCGYTANDRAGLILLDDAGGAIWQKETDDREYWDVVATAGGFALTGESDSLQIVLALVDDGGNPLWSREYGLGTGGKLLQDPDGGFVVAARSAVPNGLTLIKTGPNGEAAPVEEAVLFNRHLESENLKVTLASSPSLFFDGYDPTLLTSADTASTLFAFAPWIGGYDGEQVLHLAADDYFVKNRREYRTGVTQGPARDFNRVWRVKREQIEKIRQDFGADQTLDQPPPFDVLTWPAKGNPHLRYNLGFEPVETDPALFPAPFEDVNNDGLYNVYDGDYPRIKGDQMAWWVLSDSTKHENSQGEVLGVDLAISVYMYGCPGLNPAGHSLFADFEVINRSDKSYVDTYMGFFADLELGCRYDDNLGSLPDVNAFYVYNADEYDENCSNASGSFESNIPVQSVAFTNRSLNHFITFDNPIIGTPNPGVTDPDLPIEFYRYLKGLWKDGSPISIGGNGYDPGSTSLSEHVFPGNPADPQGWSMCTADLPFADRRSIGSHGPFNFAAGDTFLVQIAFTLHPDIPHPCPDIFSLVKPAVAQITHWKNQGKLDVALALDPVVSLPAGQSVTLDPGPVPGASYLWSTGAGTRTIGVDQPGEYSVTVTAVTGCQIVQSTLVQAKTPAPEPPASPVWSFMPNPARDYVHITCPDCREEEFLVVLHNAQGAMLTTRQDPGPQVRLDIRNYAPGFYWLELWQRGQFLGSRKLVVGGQ